MCFQNFQVSLENPLRFFHYLHLALENAYKMLKTLAYDCTFNICRVACKCFPL